VGVRCCRWYTRGGWAKGEVEAAHGTDGDIDEDASAACGVIGGRWGGGCA
jgi:hypothetical protein